MKRHPYQKFHIHQHTHARAPPPHTPTHHHINTFSHPTSLHKPWFTKSVGHPTPHSNSTNHGSPNRLATLPPTRTPQTMVHLEILTRDGVWDFHPHSHPHHPPSSLQNLLLRPLTHLPTPPAYNTSTHPIRPTNHNSLRPGVAGSVLGKEAWFVYRPLPQS